MLKFQRCLFEYKGREYMLYPGDSEYHMSIDTIISDEREEEIVFESIHEFLYLFGWDNHYCFHYLGSCTLGLGNKNTLLERKIPLYKVPRRMRCQASFDYITDPNVSEDFKKAISLYNDAKYTNDIYHSFLCLYKIIDLPVKGKTREPGQWINLNVDLVIDVNNKELFDFVKTKTDFGGFIRDECRNAIEHIHRNRPGKSSILPFKASDYKQISLAKAVMFDLADTFIRNEIGVSTKESINIIKIDNE
jgi:hypothetical protein